MMSFYSTMSWQSPYTRVWKYLILVSLHWTEIFRNVKLLQTIVKSQNFVQQESFFFSLSWSGVVATTHSAWVWFGNWTLVFCTTLTWVEHNNVIHDHRWQCNGIYYQNFTLILNYSTIVYNDHNQPFIIILLKQEGLNPVVMNYRFYSNNPSPLSNHFERNKHL